MTELALRNVAIVEHDGQVGIARQDSGELLPLTHADTAELAEALDYIRGEEEKARTVKRALAGEVLRRQDQRGKWTFHEDGYTLVGDPPDRTELDVDLLVSGLRRLMDERVIPVDTFIEAVGEHTAYRPDRRVLNRLKKLGGEVRAVVERCERPVERPRRVQVKRAA